MSVRTVFIGTGTFGLDALRALAAAPDVTLVGVVTAPPRPAGRKGTTRESPVAGAARELGVGEILAPERLRRPESVEGILGLRPDLIVLADYGQIVPPALLDVRFGALNLHPSLLPRHRGASPIPATILAGDELTGVALMRMNAGLDTGPVLATADVPLEGTETAPALEAMLAALGADLLLRCLVPWIRGELDARPQPLDGATITRPLRRDDGRLDPSRAAVSLERQVRAFQPWPGSWIAVPAGRFTVWRADVAPSQSDVRRGDLYARPQQLLLATADGALVMREIQPAGGNRMSGEDALRGRPALLRERVESPGPGLAPEPIERPVGYSPSR